MLEIHEIKPGGKSTIDALIKRMGDMSRRSDDMRDVWKALAEYVRKEFTFEFSHANPAGWGALSAKYLQWKSKNGYPATIGIMTGALKKAMTSSAVIDPGPQTMTYELNENVEGRKGKTVGSYAKYFDHYKDGTPKRPIIAYVQGRMRTRAREAVRKFVKDGETL